MPIFDHFSRFPKKDEMRFQDRSKYDKERRLMTALNAEMVNQHGVPMWYYEVSYDRAYDPLFGEDNDQRIFRKTRINTICELPKKDEAWNAFGIEGLDTFPVYIVKRHFHAVFNGEDPEKFQPEVGNFLQLLYDSRMFEITAVYQDTQTNAHKDSIVWEVRVKVWTDSHITDDLDLIGGEIRHDEPSVFEVGDVEKTLDGLIDTPPSGWSETSGKGHDRKRYDPKPEEQSPKDPFGGF